ncbi:MAG TPA: opioid growth factor receptor-related protein [Gemmataceae bacterium]|nr:opioid growth factor receptor-related protein [Gemmataceae bacterium]
MSQLVNFYRGEATDSAGRSLHDIWSWNDEDWEEVHDFIQWLFPLPEPSRFNADAPLLAPKDIAAFRSDELLRANLRKSFARALTFLGLSLAEDGAVVEGANFAARIGEVWAAPNHNWLRITRILRSLRIVGLTTESANLYRRLEVFYHSGRFPIPADTFRYWTE